MAERDPEGIEERLLYGKENLVVAVPDRVAELARCYVFQTLPGGWSPLRWRPLDLRDDTGAEVRIASESGVDYQPLYDSNGDDILRIPKASKNRFLVYHFSLAVQQNRIRLYPLIPETQTGGGFTYLSATEPDPTAGDPQGYILGEETNFMNPPRELEAVSFMAGDTSVIQYGFYNEHPDRRIIPRMHVKGRSYLLKPVVEENLKKKIVYGKIPRTMVSAGAIKDSFEPGVPDAWDSAEIDIEEAVFREMI